MCLCTREARTPPNGPPQRRLVSGPGGPRLGSPARCEPGLRRARGLPPGPGARPNMGPLPYDPPALAVSARRHPPQRQTTPPPPSRSEPSRRARTRPPFRPRTPPLPLPPHQLPSPPPASPPAPITIGSSTPSLWLSPVRSASSALPPPRPTPPKLPAWATPSTSIWQVEEVGSGAKRRTPLPR
jgi:hypothetical protein